MPELAQKVGREATIETVFAGAGHSESIPVGDLPARYLAGVTSSLPHPLEAMTRAFSAIASPLEVKGVAEAVATQVVELIGCVSVAVVMLHEPHADRFHTVASRGLSAFLIDAITCPYEDSPVSHTVREGSGLGAWEVDSLPYPAIADALRRDGHGLMLCAPLQAYDQLIGAVYVCGSGRCDFSHESQQTLTLLADHSAISLTNARKARELRARADEARSGLHRVGQALAASLDLQETLELIVQLAVDMTHAEAGAMYLMQPEQEGGNLVLSASKGLDRRSLRRFRVVPPSPLARRALIERRAVPIQDTRRRSDTPFPVLQTDGETGRNVRSVVCVPAYAGDRVVGVLEQYSAEPGRFDHNDIQLLSGFALHAAVAIENARLYTAEKNAARTLQRAFLPDTPPDIPGFQFGKIYAPGNQISAVGGDTFDLFPLPDGRVALLMADVSGQGTSAATLAVMVKYTMRAYALENPEPSAMLSRLNEALVHQTDESTFVTICYALLDPKTRCIEMATAAHPPAIHFHGATKACEPLKITPGLFAGFFKGETYPAITLQLEPDDVLVFYTDGVIEARREKVLFDETRLKTAVEENADFSAQDIAASLYAAVFDYTEGDLRDDLALLVLKAE